MAVLEVAVETNPVSSTMWVWAASFQCVQHVSVVFLNNNHTCLLLASGLKCKWWKVLVVNVEAVPLQALIWNLVNHVWFRPWRVWSVIIPVRAALHFWQDYSGSLGPHAASGGLPLGPGVDGGVVEFSGMLDNSESLLGTCDNRHF